jgi:hypothetical protein
VIHVCRCPAIRTPFSFDFLWQMMNLKLYCRVHDIPKVAVQFDPAPPDFEPVFGRGDKANLDGIMRPILKMLGILEVTGATPDFEVPCDNMSTWVEAYKTYGWLPPKLKPERVWNDWVEEQYTDPFWKDMVTITRRESSYQAYRNSNVQEWFKIGEWLRRRAYSVLFIRDTAKAFDRPEAFAISADAAKNLHVRVSIYQRAKMNLFTANGPGTICTATNDIPYLMMIPPSTIDMFERLQKDFNVAHIGDIKPRGYLETDQWTAWLGIAKNEQIPWANTKKQRLEWQAEDTYANIRNALEQLEF